MKIALKTVVRVASQSLGLSLLVALSPGLAQTQNPSHATPSGSAPSSSPSKPKPAADSTADKSGSQKPAVPDPKKSKKVWTNDDLGSVSGTVSVVGEASATGSGVRSGSLSDAARKRMAEGYRSQIQQLQTQVEATDARISQLKKFKADNTSPSGGINPYQGYNMVPLEDQVKQLEDRKKQLQARIDDLENDAKKYGIEPGDLR
jgi:hypothetical protein